MQGGRTWGLYGTVERSSLRKEKKCNLCEANGAHDWLWVQAGDFDNAKFPAAMLQENSPDATWMLLPYAPVAWI